MTPKRSESTDYTSLCTVCIDYEDAGVADRIVYERPQSQLPGGRMTALDLARLSQYADDETLTAEALAIFAEMKDKGRIGPHATVMSIFIARSAAAALEMNL